MSDEITPVEELPLEDQKKAINLQDLLYVKQYIDMNHYDKDETDTIINNKVSEEVDAKIDDKMEVESAKIDTALEEITTEVNARLENCYDKNEVDATFYKKTDKVDNAANADNSNKINNVEVIQDENGVLKYMVKDPCRITISKRDDDEIIDGYRYVSCTSLKKRIEVGDILYYNGETIEVTEVKNYEDREYQNFTGKILANGELANSDVKMIYLNEYYDSSIIFQQKKVLWSGNKRLSSTPYNIYFECATTKPKHLRLKLSFTDKSIYTCEYMDIILNENTAYEPETAANGNVYYPYFQVSKTFSKVCRHTDDSWKDAGITFYGCYDHISQGIYADISGAYSYTYNGITTSGYGHIYLLEVAEIIE